MIMTETKDKFEPKHTFVVHYTYTRSRARAIFNYILIVLKRQVYVQWILPTVRGTQREYSSKTLKRSIVKRILVFERWI